MRTVRILLVVVLLLAGVFFAVSLDAVRAQSGDAPEILNVFIEEITSSTAVISWETDKETDAQVNYGLDQSYGISRDAEFGNQHTVKIEGLEPSRQYFFRVRSADESANQSFAEGFSFTTEASQQIEEVEEILDEDQRTLTERVLELLDQIDDLDALELIAEKLQEKAEDVFDPVRIIGEPGVEVGVDFAEIRWSTDREANSVVEFATEAQYDPNDPEEYVTSQGDIDELVTDHVVRVTGLAPATTYHFRVVSIPTVGPAGQSGDFTFTTKSILPTFSDVRLEKVEEESATISWRTNVPTRGQVRYTNLDTLEEKTVGDPTFLTRHTIQLTDLIFDTTYEAVVEVENEAGERAESNALRFTTTRDEFPPVISKINNESTLYPGEEARIQTIVSWNTDEPSYCQFFFHQSLVAPKEDISSLSREAQPVTDHVQVITAFAPSTVYKFWLECEDDAGNSSRSEDFVLFTPQKEKSIIDIILENFEGTFGWVKNIGK